jgi:hypothetical protein
MLVARTQTFDQRAAILDRLIVRNRLVAVLRVAVPAAGVAVLLVLVGQIWFANLARQYGVSGISIDRGQLVVETPQYSATGADGSRYQVSAKEARTDLTHPDTIAMTDPHLLFGRPGKPAFRAVAASARVETTRHVVTIPGVVEVASDDGLSGTLHDVTADVEAQLTDARGPVDLIFPDGTHLVADSLHFDGHAALWTFDNATLTVAGLPGAQIGWGNVFAVFGTEASP